MQRWETDRTRTQHYRDVDQVQKVYSKLKITETYWITGPDRNKKRTGINQERELGTKHDARTENNKTKITARGGEVYIPKTPGDTNEHQNTGECDDTDAQQTGGGGLICPPEKWTNMYVCL